MAPENNPVRVKRTITDCENHSAIESQSFLTNGRKTIAMAKQACLNSFDVIVAVETVL
jgi:hypothetical protein